MGKRVAVVLVGLCNVKQQYFKYVYKVFDELRAEGYQIDFFCHFWSTKNVYPKHAGKRSDGVNSYVPTDSINLQNELIRYLSPKEMIYSEYCEITKLESFLRGAQTPDFPSYVGFVNLNAQFFGFQKMIDSVDFSDYDFVLKWRYDILGCHDKKYVGGIANAIDHCINDENRILFNNHSDSISSVLGLKALEDTIFGISTKSLNRFSDFAEFMTTTTSARLSHSEIRIAQFAEYKQFNLILANYVYTFIRPYTQIDNNEYEEDIMSVISKNPQSKLPLHLKNPKKR